MRIRENRLRVGFTLVELMITIAIIGVLLTLLLTAVQSSRQAAARTQCLNRLRQFGVGLHNYHSARGVFPTAYDLNGWTWLAHLLPEMGEQSLHSQIDFSRDTREAINDHQPVTAVRVASYVCPSDPRSDRRSAYFDGRRAAYTNYFGVSGTIGGVEAADYVGTGMFPSTGKKRKELKSKKELGPRISLKKVTDGTSKTLFVGERPINGNDLGRGDVGWWALGTGIPTPYGRGEYILDSSNGLRPGSRLDPALENATHWWSHHPGGAQFLFVDGSARMFSYDTNQDILLGLSTRSGGEYVDSK